jgi:hypothetical protein
MAARNLQRDASSGCKLEEPREEVTVVLYMPCSVQKPYLFITLVVMQRKGGFRF